MADRIIHYVDPQGRIHKVAHQGENNGRVDIRFSDGRTQNVSSMDVANTGAAANVMAVNRRVTLSQKVKVESPKILR